MLSFFELHFIFLFILPHFEGDLVRLNILLRLMHLYCRLLLAQLIRLYDLGVGWWLRQGHHLYFIRLCVLCGCLIIIPNYLGPEPSRSLKLISPVILGFSITEYHPTKIQFSTKN